MNALVENRSLEARIADCCREIYWTRDAEIAMWNWNLLRELTGQKEDADLQQFIRETLHR